MYNREGGGPGGGRDGGREGGRSDGPRGGGGGRRPDGPRGGGGGRDGGRGKRRGPRRKVCRFTEEGVLYIDFKNYRLLREYITDRGKIMPRRITGTSSKHQRMLTQAIKRAREIGFLPYVKR